MLLRQKHILLRVLKLRAIVNSNKIIELPEMVPVIIASNTPTTKLVIGNGFHFSKELEVASIPGNNFFYEINCIIDDIRLFYLIFLSLLFFLIFIITNLMVFMVIANLPVLYLCYVFYFLRKNFVIINPMGVRNDL